MLVVIIAVDIIAPVDSDRLTNNNKYAMNVAHENICMENGHSHEKSYL